MSETTKTRRRRFASGAACLCGAAVAPASARAAVTLSITNDTYIDSYQAVAGATGLDNTRINYGSSAAVKAVTSGGSTAYPAANSLTHTLFTLPSTFWSTIGSANVSSAVVTYAVRNNQLAGRNVELHPLTQSFVAGTGGVASSTMGGTNNSSGSPIGADWYTYNGSAAWTTPGGDYDPTATVLQTAGTSGGQAVLTWDITSLINNPTTRAEVQLDGLLLDVANEIPYPATNTQQFVSFYSADSAAYTGNAAQQPSVTFTAVPEPTTTAIAGTMAGLTLLRRRRTPR